MDSMDRALQLIDRISSQLTEMSIILAKNTVTLEDHKKRSDLSEKRLELLEKEMNQFRGFFSIGGWLLGIAATVITLIFHWHGIVK